MGILLALALYGDAAGAVGHGVDRGLGSFIGWIRFLVPPIAVVAGLWIISGRARPDLTRTSLGTGLAVMATCGLAELAGGTPKLNATAAALGRAGGVVGVATGRSLELGVGTAGATVILVAVAIGATLITTRTTLGALGRGFRWLGSRVAGWWSALRPERPVLELVADDEWEDQEEPLEAKAPVWEPVVPIQPDEPDQIDDLADEPEPIEEVEQPAPAAVVKTVAERPGESVAWQLPPLTLLKRSVEQRQDDRQLDVAGESLVAALAAHGVETRLVGRTVGPTVTRFELELGPGVKVARVTSLSQGHRLRDGVARRAHPRPDSRDDRPSASRCPTANASSSRSATSSTRRRRAEAQHPLEVALGRDIAGRAVMANLAEMPHILISGATGAGKSSCINSIITSVLMRSTPEQVR